MAIGKILDLSDKISAGRIFEVDFEKNQKNVKNVSKKNLYCIVVWLKKYFFSKTKDEIDYSKCYKTISMPFSWYYIFFELIQRDFGLHLPIIRIRIIKTKNSALKSDNARYMYVCMYVRYGMQHKCIPRYPQIKIISGLMYITSQYIVRVHQSYPYRKSHIS